MASRKDVVRPSHMPSARGLVVERTWCRILGDTTVVLFASDNRLDARTQEQKLIALFARLDGY